MPLKIYLDYMICQYNVHTFHKMQKALENDSGGFLFRVHLTDRVIVKSTNLSIIQKEVETHEPK